MSKVLAIGIAVGLAVTGFIAWSFFEGTKGNHLVPEGKIGKVRSLQLVTNETFAVIDFSVTNPSDRDMVVRGIECDLLPASGDPVQGGIVANSALQNVFRNYAALGEMFNPVLKARDRITPRQTTDRMIGVRFSVPDGTFESRKGIVIRIEDITGPLLEMRTR